MSGYLTSPREKTARSSWKWPASSQPCRGLLSYQMRNFNTETCINAYVAAPAREVDAQFSR